MITSREELKEYCLRKCGAPVITINIDDLQLEDCVDDALQFAQDYNSDFTERTYFAVEITQEIKDTGIIPVPQNIFAVSKVMIRATDSTSSADPLFDVNYQLRAEDTLRMLSSRTDIAGYFIARSYLAEVDFQFRINPEFQFNISTGRVVVQTNRDKLVVGRNVLIECYAILDLVEFQNLWNNRPLRELAAAFTKRQWGQNLSKFDQVRLPGGVTLNGNQIQEQAEIEIEKIKQDYIIRYSEPLGFIVN